MSANRSKGAKGTENWQPSDETFWYEYALYWTVAKTRRELTMTKVEAVAVIEMLQTFPTPAEVLEFKGGTRQPQESEPTEELQNPVYGSCEEAEFAGEQRFQGSQGGGLGYPKAMVPSARDGDGDGVVCER